MQTLPRPTGPGTAPGGDGDDVAHRLVIRADTAGAVGAFVQGLVACHIKFAVFARGNDRRGVAAPAPPL